MNFYLLHGDPVILQSGMGFGLKPLQASKPNSRLERDKARVCADVLPHRSRVTQLGEHGTRVAGSIPMGGGGDQYENVLLITVSRSGK